MSKQQSTLIRKLRKELRVTKALSTARGERLVALDKKCAEYSYMWEQVRQLVSRFAPANSPLHFKVFPKLGEALPDDGRVLEFPRPVRDWDSIYSEMSLEQLYELSVVLYERGNDMQAVMLADGKRYYVNTNFYREIPLDTLSNMVMEIFNKSLAELKASKQ